MTPMLKGNRVPLPQVVSQRATTIEAQGPNKVARSCFPFGSAGKKCSYNAGDVEDTGSIPGSGRFPGGGGGNPLQYSCLDLKKN